MAELNYKRFMFKKLCILLIFSKLKVTKLLIDKYRMHNLYAIFAKLLNICIRKSSFRICTAMDLNPGDRQT